MGLGGRRVGLVCVLGELRQLKLHMRCGLSWLVLCVDREGIGSSLECDGGCGCEVGLDRYSRGFKRLPGVWTGISVGVSHKWLTGQPSVPVLSPGLFAVAARAGCKPCAGGRAVQLCTATCRLR